MIYEQIGKYIHLLMQPLQRKRTEVEMVYSSGGSWFENSKDRGKKHLMEHCIASRTRDLDFKSFQNYQFSKNIFVNAFTAPLTMGVNSQGHSEDAKDMLDKILEIGITPTFDQSILEQEREIVLREIAERSGDPNYRLHYAVMNKVFTKDSYDTHEVLGDSKMVSESKLSDFIDLHKQNLSQSHLIFSLSGGGFDPKEVKQQITEFFSDNSNELIKTSLSSEKKHPVDFQVDSYFNDFDFLPVVNDLAHEHAEVTIYIPIQLNFENKPARRLFEELFLKYYGVLYDRLRNKEGLIYSMYTSFEDYLNHLVINFSSEIPNISKIMDIVRETFSSFEATFDQSKFDQMRDIVRKKTDISDDTLSAGTNFSESSLFTYGIFEDLDGFLKRLNKVSPEDVKAIFEEIRDGLKAMKVVVVSKNSAIEKLVVLR